MEKHVILSLAAAMFVASPVWALRPLATDDAGVVDVGSIEVEVGYDHSRNGGDEKAYSIGTAVTTGLSERMDLGVAVCHETVKDGESTEQGMGTGELGLKFALIKDIISFTFTYAPGDSEYGLNGIFSREIGPLTGHLNLGYTATGVVGERGATTWGGALDIPVTRKIFLVSEITAESHSTPVWQGLVGAYLPVSESLTIDLGFEKEIDAHSSVGKLTFGLTYAF